MGRHKMILTDEERKSRRNKQKAEWWAKHPELKHKHNTSWQFRYTTWKRGAKVRNIEFSDDLTLEYIKSLPLKCYYTGMDLTLDSKKDNTISLDRLDSSKGYTKDNVVLCCWRINQMKNDMSVEEFYRWINIIK